MKESLNIVLYVNNFLPKIGGREMVVYHLANSLNAMGHRVRILGPYGWWKNRKAKFAYPVHRWPTLRGLFKDQIAFSQLLLDVSIWGCDIIHAHNTYPTGYAASGLKAIRNYPLVITPHGEDIQTIPEINFGMRLDTGLRKKIDKAIQSADLLTAISKNVEDALIDAGAEKDKIHSIPNGVDLGRYQQQKFVNMRDWLKLPSEAKIILTVGNYERRRGHEELVRAMPKILRTEPDARLVIVGKLTEALIPLLQELDIEDKVVLTGSVSSPDMAGGKEDLIANIYRSSNVYISAGVNENAEGLSLALLDGMAAGLPIVATNISGNRDVVKDGKNGFLVPPSDPDKLAEQIVCVLQNSDMQKLMSDESFLIAGKYSWHEIAHRYLEIYQKLLQ